MGWDIALTLGVVVTCFALMARSRAAPDLVMSAGLTVLLLGGVLTPTEALAGFSNEGMLTVAVLYVVVTGLTETGAVGWIAQNVLGRPRTAIGTQLRLTVPVAALSAFLNNTPVVAVFVPAVKAWARRNRLSPSKLFIPLSYASIAGGTCTLIGTSTNLVVNGLLLDQPGSEGLGMFDLAWIGLPVTFVVLGFLLLLGDRLLPRRDEALVQEDRLREYTAELLVEAESPLHGQTIEQAGLRALPGLFLAEIERDGVIRPAVGPNERLMANDRLMFVGAVESVVDLHRVRGLKPATGQVHKIDGERKDRAFFEAVLSDSCPVVGQSVKEGRFRTRYQAAIVAVARHGGRLQGKIGDMRLRAGDTLLLEAKPEFMERFGRSRDFLLVSRIGGFHPPDHARAPVALAIVAVMVLLAASGLLSMLEAALIAAGLMLVSRCTRGHVARRAPDWQVLVVIAASFGIGAALEKSGAATLLATQLLDLSDGQPLSVLALTFVLTALLSAIATNNVAAVLAFPIAVSSAQTLGVDLLPFAITIMIAASASFATPIGYQTNLMVYNAGSYRFADFLRVGLPLTVVVGVVTVALVPLFFPF